MSVNKYNPDTRELTSLATGQRVWTGTKAAHDAAAQAGTLPNNALICITDDATENAGYLEDTGAQLLNGSLSFDESNTNIVDRTIVLGQNFTFPDTQTRTDGALFLGDGSNINSTVLGSAYNAIVLGNSKYTQPVFQLTNQGDMYTKAVYPGATASHFYYHKETPAVFYSHGQFEASVTAGIECKRIGDVYQIYNTHNLYGGYYGDEHYEDSDDGIEVTYGLQIGAASDDFLAFVRNPAIAPVYYKTEHEQTNNIDSCNINAGFSSDSDGKVDLGATTARWKQIYATNSTISTSDRNKKKEIEYFSPSSAWSDDELVMFINDLKPCTYKFIDNQSNRPHHGLIAQDVEETLQALNKDHAGFIKSPVPVVIEEEKEYTAKEINPETGLEEEVTKTKRVKRSVIPEYPSYVYSLRYEEFIPDLIRYCQLLETRMKKLEIKLGE